MCVVWVVLISLLLPPTPSLLFLPSHEQAQKPQVLLGVFGMALYSLIFKHILNFISLLCE